MSTKFYEGPRVEVVEHPEALPSTVRYFGTIRAILGHDKDEFVRLIDATQADLADLRKLFCGGTA